MKAKISHKEREFSIDFSKPIDISIPLMAGQENVTAWYVNPPEFTPVMENGFVGDVNLGGAVNFRNIFFNPHGHGTHTECVGHISKEAHTINQCLKEFTYSAKLITITPNTLGDDSIIELQQLEHLLNMNETEALIIRTLPNTSNKLHYQYSNTNPTFIHRDAMQFIVDQGIQHLLVDMPSVDKEQDGGELIGHHIFWNYPSDPQIHKTITELIFVPNEVQDGDYLLQFQIASFENDASPSKPTLYEIMS